MKVHTGKSVVSAAKTIPVIALWIGLLFSRCSTNSTNISSGTGDDFPNSKVAIGLLMANSMSVISEWNDLSAMPDSINPGIYSADTLLNSVVTDTANKLSKTAVGVKNAVNVIWDYSDTLQGIASYDRINDGWFTINELKVVVRYNELAKDSIFGNETIIHVHGTVRNKILGSTIVYDISDADSNGLLDTAYIIQQTPEIGQTRCNAAYGSWGNRSGIKDASHIRYSCLELFFVTGTDTTSFFQLRDRDGDGCIYVKGQTANKIRLVHTYKNPFALLPRQPVAGTLVLEGVLASNSLSLLNADRRLEAHYLYRDNTRDSVTITCTHPDSLLSNQDTIMVAINRSTPDRLLYDNLVAQFVLVSADDTTGYNLASVSLIASSFGSGIKELRCSFIPDAPMIPNQLVKFSPGYFEATIVYSQGTQGKFQGRLSNGSFLMRYIAADGSSQDISYSQSGEPLQ
jgi:hypothetical protein